jgi:hypothetical protein
MASKKSWFKMPVIVLLLEFVSIVSLYAQTDSRLNGIWVSSENGIETEYRLNNGNFESTMNKVSMQRGTYTTNNGEITINETHIFGGWLDTLGLSGLEPRWYTKNEFIIAFRNILTGYGVLTESQINEFIYQSMQIFSYTYSVDVNTLILSSEKQVIIFTKR